MIIGNSTKPRSVASANDGQERLLLWTGHGLSPAWIRDRLLPASLPFQHHLAQVEDDEAPHSLEKGGGDWDVLFVGSADAHRNPAEMALLISRLSRLRPMDCLVAVVLDQNPEAHLTLFRAGATDVLTENADRNQIEQTLGHLVDILQTRRSQVEQDKLRLVSQLAVSVNHEINNPLAGLMGTAELLLLEGRNLDEKVRHDLQTIITQCHRIQEVTSRLKTLNHLRTVPYGSHDQMIDLIGELQPGFSNQSGPGRHEQFLPTPRILVVDDNPLIIDLIARMFESRFLIDAASGAAEALLKAERGTYDLLLIDLILPEMNGLELYRAIRRMKPNQKALLTTAYEGDARVEQAIAEGALGCIYKPFQLEELEAALMDAIKQKVG